MKTGNRMLIISSIGGLLTLSVPLGLAHLVFREPARTERINKFIEDYNQTYRRVSEVADMDGNPQNMSDSELLNVYMFMYGDISSPSVHSRKIIDRYLEKKSEERKNE